MNKNNLMDSGGVPDQQPDPETGEVVVTKLLDQGDLIPTSVKATFTNKETGEVDLPAKRWNFATKPAAHEFMTTLSPDAFKIGSPKQAKAKRAAKLRIPPHILDTHDVHLQIITNQRAADVKRPAPEPERPEVDTEFEPGGGPTDGVSAADSAPVHDRPSGPQPRGLHSLSAALSGRTTDVQQDGREAEVGGEVSGSEAGPGGDDSGDE